VQGAPIIVSIGRLERYKGHHRVLDAMPLVLRAYPAARLRIVGTGPMEEHLHRRAARLGIAHAVDIGPIDPLDRDAMGDLLARASLVTLLSDYEAHPISVMETLALGRPMLVTYTSGLAEIADRGLVRSVPLSSGPDEIAQALVQNLRDPLFPDRTTLPSWDTCAAELADLYSDVLRERECAS
jgi:glycosyltransferase involved in cell wall biosynthesis